MSKAAKFLWTWWILGDGQPHSRQNHFENNLLPRVKGLPGIEGCQQQQGQAVGRVKGSWGKLLLEGPDSGTTQGGPHSAPRLCCSAASQHGSQTPCPQASPAQLPDLTAPCGGGLCRVARPCLWGGAEQKQGLKGARCGEHTWAPSRAPAGGLWDP